MTPPEMDRNSFTTCHHEVRSRADPELIVQWSLRSAICLVRGPCLLPVGKRNRRGNRKLSILLSLQGSCVPESCHLWCASIAHAALLIGGRTSPLHPLALFVGKSSGRPDRTNNTNQVACSLRYLVACGVLLIACAASHFHLLAGSRTVYRAMKRTCQKNGYRNLCCPRFRALQQRQ